MRKINISNDSRRDAEVAFGSSIHRQQPVYKTSNGKRSVNERRVRCTLKTTDEALLNQYGENLASVLVVRTNISSIQTVSTLNTRLH